MNFVINQCVLVDLSSCFTIRFAILTSYGVINIKKHKRSKKHRKETTNIGGVMPNSTL